MLDNAWGLLGTQQKGMNRGPSLRASKKNQVTQRGLTTQEDGQGLLLSDSCPALCAGMYGTQACIEPRLCV